MIPRVLERGRWSKVWRHSQEGVLVDQRVPKVRVDVAGVCSQLLLHAGRGDALDDVALSDDVDDEDGDDRDRRAGHEQGEVRGVLAAEEVYGQGHRIVVDAVQEDQRPEEVVPLEQEREDAEGGQGRPYEREYDPPVDRPAVGAVHDRRLLQVHGEALDELPEQEDAEGIEQSVGDDEREERVDQAEVLDDYVEGDDRDLLRDHQGGQKQDKERMPEREFYPGEGVGGHRAREQIRQDDRHGDDGAVHVARVERYRGPRVRVILEHEGVRDPVGRYFVELSQVLDRAEQHPREGHDHDDCPYSHGHVEQDRRHEPACTTRRFYRGRYILCRRHACHRTASFPGRALLVVDPAPLHPELQQGEAEDDREQHHGDRGAPAVDEVDEGEFPEVVDHGDGRVGRAPVKRQDERLVEDLERVDDGDDEDEERGGRKKR